MNYRSALYVFLMALHLVCLRTYAQKEFFRSQQSFSKDQLNTIYSSITIDKDLVLFNAVDYRLYAYSKKDGELKWVSQINYKSLNPVFIQDSIVYTAYYSDKTEHTAQLNLANGKLIKTLPFGPLATRPVIRNGVLYGTAIYDYGCILAYNLSQDSVTWSRFIAHGFSNQPYYFDNRIIANAEADNWFELGYDGVLLDTVCKNKADIFVENIPCIKKYSVLSHDGLPIKGKLSDDIFGKDLSHLPDMLTSSNATFALNETKLSIVSKKLKIKQQIDLSQLTNGLEDLGNTKLLKADDENIWIAYSNHLLQYNHQSKKLEKLTDLSQWQPEVVVLDQGNIWLVSSETGLLYGISL